MLHGDLFLKHYGRFSDVLNALNAVSLFLLLRSLNFFLPLSTPGPRNDLFSDFLRNSRLSGLKGKEGSGFADTNVLFPTANAKGWATAQVEVIFLLPLYARLGCYKRGCVG